MQLSKHELRAKALVQKRRAASAQGTRVSPLVPHSREWHAKKHVAQERVSKTPRRRGKGKCHADFDDDFRLAKVDPVQSQPELADLRAWGRRRPRVCV